VSWHTASKADSAVLSVAEVRAKTGLSARTLRYYEELGLLPGVRRRAGGRRVFGPDEVERLRFIQRLKALGLSLAEIKGLNAVYGIEGSTRAMLDRLDVLLGHHLAEIDGRLEELMGLRDEITKYRDHIESRRLRMTADAAATAKSRDGSARREGSE